MEEEAGEGAEEGVSRISPGRMFQKELEVSVSSFGFRTVSQTEKSIFLKNKDFQKSKAMGHSGSVLTDDFDSGVGLIPGSPSLSLKGEHQDPCF